MKTIQRSLATLIIVSAAGSSRADDFHVGDLFKTIHHQMQQTQAEIEKFFDEIPAMESKTIGYQQATPSIAQDDSHIVISMELPEVDDENINVRKLTDKNGEYLLVEIPHQGYKTEITITDNMVNSTTEQEAEEKTTKDDKESTYYTHGTSHYLQTLPAEVSLQDVKAEYNDNEKKLTITLQKTQPISSQTIPIVKK